MKGRPNLYTDYRKETAILNTTTQKLWAGIGLVSFIYAINPPAAFKAIILSVIPRPLSV